MLSKYDLQTITGLVPLFTKFGVTREDAIDEISVMMQEQRISFSKALSLFEEELKISEPAYS